MPPEKGVMDMLRPKKAWITYKPTLKRWEVGLFWQGKPERFYQWEGIPHTEESIAEKHKEQIESELKLHYDIRSPFKFDPQKHKKRIHKRSVTLFENYITETWLKEYDLKLRTNDVNREYVTNLKGYFRLHILPELGDFERDEINDILIKNFYLHLMEKDFKKKHVQNIMDALQKSLKDAHMDIPFPKYRTRKSRENVDFLDEQQQDLVVSYVSDIDKPIAMTYLFYGLRSIEARTAKRKDLRDNVLHIHTAKGGPDRELLIDSPVMAVIKSMPLCLKHDYLFHHSGAPYSKTGLWKVIREALDKAGFKDMTPGKAGRHSFASQLYRRGANTPQVQYMMGHADSRTTEIYSHYRVEDQKKVGRE